MNTTNFCKELSLNLRENDIIIPDAGSSFFECAREIKLKEGMRFITSGLGTMGYSMPVAIGAWFAQQGRIICVIGDGGFQLNIQELQTIIYHKIPLKIFYINNGGYATIRNTQKKYFGRYTGESYATGVSFPSIRKIARTYGIYYTTNMAIALKQRTAVICEIK